MKQPPAFPARISRRPFLLAALLFGPAACSVLPKPTAPPQLFRLTPVPAGGPPGPVLPIELFVAAPTAPAAINTDRIALSRGPTRVDYFADAAWTDAVPRMLQELVVESLQNSGRLRAVGRDTIELRAEAMLTIELRHFEAAYNGSGPPLVQVAMECRLATLPERKLIASRLFATTAAAPRNDLPTIVDAFNAAFHGALQEIIPWTAASLAPRGS